MPLFNPPLLYLPWFLTPLCSHLSFLPPPSHTHTSLTLIFFQQMSQGESISIDQLKELDSVIFGQGRRGSFSEAWYRQGFGYLFSRSEDSPMLGYGLYQKNGGPCGIMAVVQAFILKHLLFGPSGAKEKNRKSLLCPSRQQRQEALLDSLSSILWRAGSAKGECVVVLPVGRSHRYVLSCCHVPLNFPLPTMS